MAITQTLVTSFLKELLTATHDFSAAGGHSFKIALYTSTATLDATTTVYSATNEVASGGGYTTGGEAMTNIEPTSSGTTGLTDFSDVPWAGATFTTRGALIYNTSASNAAVAVLDFGSDRSPSAETFTVVFPAADADNAIIRITSP